MKLNKMLIVGTGFHVLFLLANCGNLDHKKSPELLVNQCKQVQGNTQDGNQSLNCRRYTCQLDCNYQLDPPQCIPSSTPCKPVRKDKEQGHPSLLDQKFDAALKENQRLIKEIETLTKRMKNASSKNEPR